MHRHNAVSAADDAQRRNTQLAREEVLVFRQAALKPLTITAMSKEMGADSPSAMAPSNPTSAAPWLKPNNPSNCCRPTSSIAQSRVSSHPRNPSCHHPKPPRDNDGASTKTN
jgi:hypothetical protein